MKIAISGITGRMGKAIMDEIARGYSNQIQVVLGIAKESGTEVDGIQVVGAEELENKLEGIDGIIDFSAPEASEKILLACAGKVRFIVSGTTGFSAEQLKAIEKKISGSSSSIMISPNFSPLVNTQILLCEKAAGILSRFGYDFGLVEEHHTKKKDSPSGTAKKIISKVISSANLKGTNYWKEEVRTQEKGKMDVAVMRTGGTPGLHDLRIVGEHGRLSIESLMYSRNDFAKGSIEALLWLSNNGEKGKSHGFEEVLEL